MKSNLNLAKYLLKISKKAYKFAEKQNLVINDKKAHDLVTSYDLNIEKFLIKKLNTDYPNIKIVSEEYNKEIEATGTYFAIDPIDGTLNFSNNIPDFAVQIAYVENNETLASSIYFPNIANYIAGKDCGAYRNGKRIHTIKRELYHSLAEIVGLKKDENFSSVSSKLCEKVLDERRCGASCRIFANLAEGKLGALIAYGKVNSWDVLPGILLANEAGCVTKEENDWLVTANSEENLNKVYEIIHSFKKYKSK